MLTERQLHTLKHLKEIGITTPVDIVSYCLNMMDRPRSTPKHLAARRRGTAKNMKSPRKKGRKYYQEIINYIAQGGTI